MSGSGAGAAPVVAVSQLRRDFTVRHAAGRLRRTATLVQAVAGISFQVQPGECVEFIGANGAGKSTTIKMITGILAPTSGTVRTCGLDPARSRRELASRMGVVFGQRSQLWWDLPLRESFRLLGAMHRLSDRAWQASLDRCADLLGLGPFLSTPVRQLSLGQRMRGEVTAALLHSPALLVLDEPTIGLDIVSKERLRTFLSEQRRDRGTTILLTTHDLPDIERLANRMLVIDAGRLAFAGTRRELAAAVGSRRVVTVQLAGPVRAGSSDDDRPPRLDGIAGTRVSRCNEDRLEQELTLEPDTSAAAVIAAVAARAELRDLTVAEPDITDIVRALYAAAAAGTARATEQSRRGAARPEAGPVGR